MAIYRKAFLTPHRAGYKYQRAVPKALQPIIGKSAWVTYLGNISRGDAEAAARKLGAHHDALIRRLKGLSAHDRDIIADYDGLHGLGERAMIVEAASVALASLSDEIEPDPSAPETDQAEAALLAYRTKGDAEQFAAEAQAMSRMVARATGKRASGHSLHGLVTLWEKVKQPRHRRASERVQFYMDRLVGAIGERDPADITQNDIVQFRNHLAESELSQSSQLKHLDSIRSVFAVAVSEGVMAVNPAAGIKVRKVRDKHVDKIKRKPFTEAQVKVILEKAKTRFRTPMFAKDARWVLMLLAYHGARVGEVCQLRKEDVRKENGIALFHIHDEHGAVKNAASVRKVPLHPACMDFLAYAEAAKGPWVFGFTDYEEGGRAGWLVRNFPRFRRFACEIKDDSKLTLHSLRHRWIDAAREIEMPENIRKAIVGHVGEKGAHGGYGEGVSLRKRARWIAKVDPTK